MITIPLYTAILVLVGRKSIALGGLVAMLFMPMIVFLKVRSEIDMTVLDTKSETIKLVKFGENEYITFTSKEIGYLAYNEEIGGGALEKIHIPTTYSIMVNFDNGIEPRIVRKTQDLECQNPFLFPLTSRRIEYNITLIDKENVKYLNSKIK